MHVAPNTYRTGFKKIYKFHVSSHKSQTLLMCQGWPLNKKYSESDEETICDVKILG